MEEQKDQKNIRNGGNGMFQVTALSGMYEDWFLDYASYVILERAVPHLDDGLKPVQRRILHSMKRMDDGRYNKVANIIGHSMQFHPHGDASIGDALVQLGQKELLIDTQGNWGNLFTGDGSAAPRYIEARLSKLALDIVFNPKTTDWKLSYDGRNKEPLTLPVKFPLLLAQGVEGIAVGLASKILPHNFIELIDASINFLKGESFVLYPDFPTGGMADCSKYQDGLRGGAVKVRARIEKQDKKTLVIKDIPFGRTTTSLIDSIIKANEKGKIKIKKIHDNTSDEVEIQIEIANGTSADKTIDALYAFTDCELSISPNSCVIKDEQPVFMPVSDILKANTLQTKQLLIRELEIRKGELEREWHLSSLEKIFIEKRIYRDIEECETWEAVIEAIDAGLEPYKKLLRREVSRDDIVKLTEIKIKRISKYDVKKADEHIKGIEVELEEVQNHLENITDYTINYYRQIKKKHSKGRERKTELRSFETIEATKVVAANARLYANLKEGFIGTGLRKDEFVCECSDIDDILVIRKDGTYLVTKVADKVFVGKDILHAAVFKKNDKRTIYNLIYRDGLKGFYYAKRFAITGITRDKEYQITKGTEGSRILYFSVNPNGEAEVIKITHKPKPRLKKLNLEFDFSELAIKGKTSMGNIITRHGVHKINLKEKGESTLGGRKIWFNEDVFRLNVDGYGKYLGEFNAGDRIMIITKSGFFRLSNFDLSNHYEDDIMLIEKYRAGRVYSAVYYDGGSEFYYVKRFSIEESEKPQSYLNDHPDTKLVRLTEEEYPRLEISFGGQHKEKENEIIEVAEYIGVKSHKAKGKRLTHYAVKNISEIEPVMVREGELSKAEEEAKEVEKPKSDEDNDDQAQMKLDLT